MSNGQQQSSLQNVYSRSFPANNLFDISLVKDNNPDLPFYKNRYFMFLSLTPGSQTDQGGRTFNKDGRITLKTEAEKIMALANSLRAHARGQGQMGQFAIFTDSSKSGFGGQGVKTVFVSEFEQQGQQQGGQRKIALSFKTGQNKPVGVFWTPVEAMAVADIFDFIANKSLELDFEGRTNQVGKVQPQQSAPPQNNGQQNYQHQPPQNNGQNVVDNFADSMMQNQQNAPQIDEPPF